MADPKKLSTDERVQRSVSRTLSGWLALLLLLAGLAAGGYFGSFTLEPGQAAVLLLFGKHVETIEQDGLHFRLPPPFLERRIVDYSGLRNEDFGFRGKEDEKVPAGKIAEATMQTSSNNIVRVSFAVQYTIKDPFAYVYRVAEPGPVVRDAAQAAMRQVVARNTVDGVLREKRALVATDAARLLQDTLDAYDAGIDVAGVQLQDVRAPAPVQAAFDDVVSAIQDASRLVNEAEGYRNEVLPKARAEAAEVRAQAGAYRDSKIAEATGEAARFSAVAAEWRKAPEVTRTRLYLETMEAVLPDVNKVIIEPGTAQVLPYLPLGQHDGGTRK